MAFHLPCLRIASIPTYSLMSCICSSWVDRPVPDITQTCTATACVELPGKGTVRPKHGRISRLPAHPAIYLSNIAASPHSLAGWQCVGEQMDTCTMIVPSGKRVHHRTTSRKWALIMPSTSPFPIELAHKKTSRLLHFGHTIIDL